MQSTDKKRREGQIRKKAFIATISFMQTSLAALLAVGTPFIIVCILKYNNEKFYSDNIISISIINFVLGSTLSGAVTTFRVAKEKEKIKSEINEEKEKIESELRRMKTSFNKMSPKTRILNTLHDIRNVINRRQSCGKLQSINIIMDKIEEITQDKSLDPDPNGFIREVSVADDDFKPRTNSTHVGNSNDTTEEYGNEDTPFNEPSK